MSTHAHPDINDVAPLSDNDLDCLRDVREVLQRHGMTERFGVQILHSHFPLMDDEFLVEEVNSRDRTLTQRVMKIDEIALASDEGLMTTAFDLINEPVVSDRPMPRSATCAYTRPRDEHVHTEIYY